VKNNENKNEAAGGDVRVRDVLLSFSIALAFNTDTRTNLVKTKIYI